jgi:hypothetical protein
MDKFEVKRIIIALKKVDVSGGIRGIGKHGRSGWFKSWKSVR